MKEIWQTLIQSQDRSGYIGASDTSMVVGNWTTKSFENWWLEKIGLNKNNLHTEAILAGNNILIVSDYEKSFQNLLEAINEELITEEELGKSVLKILAWKCYKKLL